MTRSCRVVGTGPTAVRLVPAAATRSRRDVSLSGARPVGRRVTEPSQSRRTGMRSALSPRGSGRSTPQWRVAPAHPAHRWGCRDRQSPDRLCLTLGCALFTVVAKMLRLAPHPGRSLAMKPERRVTLEDLKRKPPVTLPLSTIVAFARLAEKNPRIAELIRIQSESIPEDDRESEANQYKLMKYAMDYLESIGVKRTRCVPLLESHRLVNAKRWGEIFKINEENAEIILKDSRHVDWSTSRQ